MRSDSRNAAKGGLPLPTLDELDRKVRLAKKVTLRDVWGLMLCEVPSTSQLFSLDQPPLCRDSTLPYLPPLFACRSCTEACRGEDVVEYPQM